MPKVFSKKNMSNTDLVGVIELKQIIVAQSEEAINFLNINHYYRVSGYWKFLLGSSTPVKFNEIISAYDIDSDIRIITFELISKFEILIKNFVVSLSLHLPNTTNNNDPHYYLDDKLFDTTKTDHNGKLRYSTLIDKIIKQLNHPSPDTFIQAYKKNYNSPQTPPIWMVVEILSLGELITLIKLISDPILKMALVKMFDLKSTEYGSLLHTTNILRNKCAHHSRLIDVEIAQYVKHLPLYLKLSTSSFKLWSSINFIFHVLKHHKQFSFILYIVDKIEKAQKTNNVDLKHYGFPSNWLERLLWFIT